MESLKQSSIQINNTAEPKHLDNSNTAIALSKIPQPFNESVERTDYIISSNIQEQNNELDKKRNKESG